MSQTPPEIERINALTQNARTTWFVLLGALVFVGITLMRVTHIDFYGVDRATTLPLVNIEVPTPSFFLAAPLLVVAIYGYFHLYLIRLWDALSVAAPTHDTRPLGDVITPWLVTDAALHLRARMRGDGCTTPRALEGLAMALNITLAWGFGLGILGLLWWQSMPARDVGMSALAGLALAVAICVSVISIRSLWTRMSAANVTDPILLLNSPIRSGLVLLTLLGILVTTLIRPASDNPNLLAHVSLAEEDLTKRPDGWVSCEFARRDALKDYADREGLDLTQFDKWRNEHQTAFREEWLRRRDSQIKSVGVHDLSDSDLRYADLRQAFGVGLKLPPSEMWTGAAISLDMFEGTRYFDTSECRLNFDRLPLKRVHLTDARLNGLNLQGTDFSEAFLYGASLVEANLRQAILTDAVLNSANLTGANLSVASLKKAYLNGAELSFAQMTGASLESAQLVSASLFGASLNNTFVQRANMQGADLSMSQISGLPNLIMSFEDVDLRGVLNDTGMVRQVDLSGAKWDETTDFRNAFMDQSVILPEGLYTRMGSPCQWLGRALETREFYSVWRWWIERSDFARHTASVDPAILEIPLPTPDRLEELGLTNCQPHQPFGPMPID